VLGSPKVPFQFTIAGSDGKLRENFQSVGPGSAPSRVQVTASWAFPEASTVARSSTGRSGTFRKSEVPSTTTVSFSPSPGPGTAP
jgi:hypothetical protein